MNEKTESIGSIVVLEEGAEFPKWVAEYQRHATNSVVVAYAPGESILEFEARVVRRLSEITGELRAAIVACGARSDPAQLAMRERLGRTLLNAMAPDRGGELLLAASVDTTDDTKHAIFELAGTLCEDLHHSQRVVRVRFSSGRPESGIMPSIGAPQSFEHPAYRAVVASRG